MGHEFILTETRDRVGIITLNRPDRLNAFNYQMHGEWRQQVDEWNQDPRIGAIVFTGAGRAFCAGADIGGWAQQIQEKDNQPQPQAAARRAPQEESWVEQVIRSKPIICAINGACIGVGLTMTLPCDVRIASNQARLSMRFIRIGVIPELGSTRILSQIVGLSQSLELMLSGRIIDGTEAARIGLVNRVVPHEELMDRALETAAEIAFNPAESVLAVKRLAWQNIMEPDLGQVRQRENHEFGAAQDRPTFKEAVTAFREKREPNFHK